MIPMRTIVCPTDFSDDSRRALAHAVTLARWYEARLSVLYVEPLAHPTLGFPAMVSPITLEPIPREALMDELRAFAEPARAAGIDSELVIREGAPVPMILEHARATGADLLVMGTHGAGGFERLILGSVTEKVLRTAPCPVLTVSRKAEAAEPHEPPALRRILCPLDFSSASQEALRYALSFAQRARARLTLLHVVDWPDEAPAHRHFNVPEYRRYLEEDAFRELKNAVPEEARDWCEVHEEVAGGKPWREIVRVAGAEQAELIVMGVHGRGAIDRMLFGASAHHVVRQAPCPVLTVRAREGQGPS